MSFYIQKPLCSAVNCKNIGVYPFPNHPERKKQWVKSLKRKCFVPHKKSKLCAAHFKPDDFHAGNLSLTVTNSSGDQTTYKMLKESAVPSIFSFNKELQPNQKSNNKRLCTETNRHSLPGPSKIKIENDLLDRFDSTQIVIKKVSSNEKESSTKKYGACRCCLKEGIHNDVNVLEMLDGLNVVVSTEPSLSTLVCVLCSNFLLQAKRFRDMVAASQDTLLAAAQSLQIHTVPIKIELDIDTGQIVKEEIEDVCTESSWLSECGDKKPDVGTWPESDDSDFMTDAAVKEELTEDPDNKMNVTAQELRIMEKMKVAELNLQIRENLSTILQYSTIIPFTTTKADQFECIYCDELFANFEIFRNHVENHNEDFDFKLQALKLLALKLDLELILRVDISNIKCKICEEEFKNIDNLVEHLINIHEKRYHNISRDPPHNVLCFNMRLESLTCLDCGKTFNAFKGLLMHMNQHYGSYLCFICGSKFLYENSYKIHLIQESKKDVRVPCKVCGATYGRKDHLARHMRNKHPK